MSGCAAFVFSSPLFFHASSRCRRFDAFASALVLHHSEFIPSQQRGCEELESEQQLVGSDAAQRENITQIRL